MTLDPSDEQVRVIAEAGASHAWKPIFAYVRDAVLEAVEWQLDHLESWQEVAANGGEVIRACDLYKAMDRIRAMKGKQG